jgi:acyl-CoA synthetase (AMP-forming)/AMP-acid ligase II
VPGDLLLNRDLLSKRCVKPCSIDNCGYGLWLVMLGHDAYSSWLCLASALVSRPKVAEAAVVDAADDTTGQAIWAFVILRQETVAEADEEGEGDALVQKLHQRVAKEIGAIARPGRS